MRIQSVLWDEDNEAHIAEHGLTIDDVESVLLNPKAKAGVSKSSGRPLRFAYTAYGIYIAVAFDVLDETDGLVYPVTAYEVQEPRSRKRS
ncbi:MAG: hypothetical protein QM703_25565 [Gemmatales bacterium]